MDGITHMAAFIKHPEELFQHLIKNVVWDERMTARKTASFGKAYNYSQINYPHQDLLPELVTINKKILKTIGFEPNNCLINYYLNGRSKMGFHSDQIDILEDNTGIVIISLGDTRILRFRNIEQPKDIMDYELVAGSLIYMTQEIQNFWQHAIPKSNSEKGRISLTFRHIL